MLAWKLLTFFIHLFRKNEFFLVHFTTGGIWQNNIMVLFYDDDVVNSKFNMLTLQAYWIDLKEKKTICMDLEQISWFYIYPDLPLLIYNVALLQGIVGQQYLLQWSSVSSFYHGHYINTSRSGRNLPEQERL